LSRYLKSPQLQNSAVAWELLRLAWSSVAALAIAPLQDLLNLGAEARMNVPGRPDGNWTWRCTQQMLSGHEFEVLCELTRNTRRLARAS
jgi:4-alpha-glucanotransferase